VKGGNRRRKRGSMRARSAELVEEPERKRGCVKRRGVGAGTSASSPRRGGGKGGKVSASATEGAFATAPPGLRGLSGRSFRREECVVQGYPIISC